MAMAAAPLVMFQAPLWLLPMAALLLACPPSQHTEVRPLTQLLFIDRIRHLLQFWMGELTGCISSSCLPSVF